jgi:hypothetical protein
MVLPPVPWTFWVTPAITTVVRVVPPEVIVVDTEVEAVAAVARVEEARGPRDALPVGPV